MIKMTALRTRSGARDFVLDEGYQFELLDAWAWHGFKLVVHQCHRYGKPSVRGTPDSSNMKSRRHLDYPMILARYRASTHAYTQITGFLRRVSTYERRPLHCMCAAKDNEGVVTSANACSVIIP